jgi:hypothetical protein
VDNWEIGKVGIVSEHPLAGEAIRWIFRFKTSAGRRSIRRGNPY